MRHLLAAAVKKVAMVAMPVITSSDDPLDAWLMSAGKFFGKDVAKWEQTGGGAQAASRPLLLPAP